MMKRELKKLNDILLNKEQEIDKLKKENINLLNRCRNQISITKNS